MYKSLMIAAIACLSSQIIVGMKVPEQKAQPTAVQTKKDFNQSTELYSLAPRKKTTYITFGTSKLTPQTGSLKPEPKEFLK